MEVTYQVNQQRDVAVTGYFHGCAAFEQAFDYSQVVMNYGQETCFFPGAKLQQDITT